MDYSSDTEGLGLSLAVYVAAIVGVFAVIMMPIYLANRPVVFENPPLAAANPLMNGPIVGYRATTIPVALLKKEPIVDPATLAALNAKSKKQASPNRPTQRVAARPAGTPVAELQPERQRRPFFLFSLF